MASEVNIRGMPTKKVLIVEDEKNMFSLLKNGLEKEGITVFGTTNGADGLKSALKNHPDLILLDIIMPKMDGLTMLYKLRQDKWGRNVKVVILTNLSDGNSVAAALKSGVYDFLVKADWKLSDLIQKVKEKLRK